MGRPPRHPNARVFLVTVVPSVLLPLVLVACGSREEGTRSGDCSDEADNDGDGLFDCDDDGCAGSPACEGGDPDADDDHDGWTVGDGDCDDEDPDVHPYADEVVADGVDQDCDGGDDCYQDGDGDGFGTTTVITSSDVDCADPGEAAVSTDCLDVGLYAASAFPGAAPHDSATDCMQDYDGDGYGSTTAPGTGAAGTDCDDVDAGVNPGEREVCGDGVDNDCDGESSSCRYTGTFDLGTVGIVITGEGAGDQAGFSVASAGDVNKDGFVDVFVGAQFDDDGGNDAGAAYLLYGPLSEDLGLATADAKLIGENRDDYAGYSVASAGDVDADGYDDLLVGALNGDDYDISAGAVYLVYGPLTGDRNLGTADAKLVGEDDSEFAGKSVASAGDVDDDGFADILVGAPGHAFGGGAAYLVYGPILSDLDLTEADARLLGKTMTGEVGRSVAPAGDVDGDGNSDVLVGASTREAYLFLGPLYGDLQLAAADTMFVPHKGGVGSSVASAGDADGDGYGDVLLGASSDDTGGRDAGAAYLVLGPFAGEEPLWVAEAKYIGEVAGDQAGKWVSSAGDVDGDGRDDSLIGAPYHDSGGADAGAVYLLYGPPAGNLDLSGADARILGAAAGDRAGISVASAGDMDSDGLGDFLVGACYNDDSGSDAGAAYLLLTAEMAQ